MNRLKIAAMVFGALSACAAVAAEGPAVSVGEIRMIAVKHGDLDAKTQLQREGWVEANGQVLDVATYRDLYRRIGRTWTGQDVAEDQFAVPKLQDETQPAISSDNPYGVLGPGDLISSGRRSEITRRSPLSYWIFAGAHAPLATSGTSR